MRKHGREADQSSVSIDFRDLDGRNLMSAEDLAGYVQSA
jgi:hypothetical protein